MFNLMNQQSQNQMQLTGNGNIRLYSAVMSLKTAFLEILNNSNYNNADINDPYVSFALNLYSKYNNDMEFHSLMQFPNHHQHQQQPHQQQQQPLSTSLLLKEPYIYHNETPFLFSLFPTFPPLPLSCLTPNILDNNLEFERLSMIGSCLLKYLIETTIFKKNQFENVENINNIVKSIINPSSLLILCKAYNIDFNYKFTNINIEPYKLFLVYFGCYYKLFLSNINGNLKENENHWILLYNWIEQLLGFTSDNDEIIIISPKQKDNDLNSSNIVTNNDNTIITATTNNTNNNNNNTTTTNNNNNYRKESKSLNDDIKNDFELQDFIQSVQQDINQSKTASSEIIYQIDDYPDLRTGFFICKLIINENEISSCTAINKKLAKSGAALLASIELSFLKFIKRSHHDYWYKKFIDRKDLIKIKLSKDQRFKYTLNNKELFNDNNNIELNFNNDFENLTFPIQRNSSNSPLEDDNDNNNNNNNLYTEVPLSTAKEKVYAFYNSKYNIVPKYIIQQLGNSKFEAKLYLCDKLVSVAIGGSKKEASAKAAMQILEQNKDQVIELNIKTN